MPSIQLFNDCSGVLHSAPLHICDKINLHFSHCTVFKCHKISVFSTLSQQRYGLKLVIIHVISKTFYFLESFHQGKNSTLLDFLKLSTNRSWRGLVHFLCPFPGDQISVCLYVIYSPQQRTVQQARLNSTRARFCVISACRNAWSSLERSTERCSCFLHWSFCFWTIKAWAYILKIFIIEINVKMSWTSALL